MYVYDYSPNQSDSFSLFFSAMLFRFAEGQPYRPFHFSFASHSHSHVFFSQPTSHLLVQLCVWVDPLDGTKEFVYGTTDTVTTLIGIAVKGAAHAGVVYKPFVDKAMWGAVGAGVFGDYKVKNFADTNPEFPRTICTSSSHSTPALVANIESLHVDKIVRIGGAGAKGLHVLTAGADAYVYPQNGTKKWDTCAIHALFEAVGGRLTDAFGDPISYFPTEPYANRNGIVASLSANHDSYLLKKGTKLS